MGTRLIVKNLPPTITEAKLRERFSSSAGGCEITDVSLKYNDSGKFRGFGFVGFRSSEDADKALTYLNGTYFGTRKCEVAVCMDLGKAPKREKEEGSEKKSSPKVLPKSKKDINGKVQDIKNLIEKYKSDAKFREFLQLNKNNSGKWNEDEVLRLEKKYAEQDDPKIEVEPTKIANDSEVSDLEYLKSLMVKADKPTPEKAVKNETYFTAKMSGLPYKAKKKDVKSFFKTADLKPKSIRVPQNVKGIAYVGFATEKELKVALSRNNSILLGHSVKVAKYHEKSTAENKEKYPEMNNKSEFIADCGRLFLRNLSYTVTESDIEELFKAYGKLAEVNLPIDKFSRKSKGFAFVTFVFPENAVTAFTELDGTSFHGRLLHIIPGKPKETENEVEDSKLSFKAKKKLKEKQSATSSHNWNTLFLGTSAVADLVSEKYDVSKKDVLLGEGQQTAAVRLALGETQIVADTKAFLEEEGVNLDAFDGDPKKLSRSKTVILIKNLPIHVNVEEIRDKFSKFGQLGRVVLPPRCVTALVEFYEPSEARIAFRALAYTKFRDTPLFLEFAPDSALSADKQPPKSVNCEPSLESQEDNEIGEDVEPEEGTTLFVKNLNFETEEESLNKLFEGIGKIHKVTIAKKRDTKGGFLSMGYGFIQYKTKVCADRALKLLQHKMLDDHCLELKKSERVAEEERSTSRKSVNTSLKECTKILVRNIPFEANKKEVEDLFKTFGQLKFLRLPKKVTGSHRGFAFAEFHTVEDAKKAFKALSHSTHLYGRRLVLEWAEQEESLETLRRKASREADIAENPKAAKKLKKSDLLSFIENGVEA